MHEHAQELARKTRAVVITPEQRQKTGGGRGDGNGAGAVVQHPQDGLADRVVEAVGLAEAIALDVVHSGAISLNKIRPATLIGKGKLDEIKSIIDGEDAELVIVDHSLTPVQQRNLERYWQVKVLDRTGLILEIFGERARTREGRLQVELAHLVYQKSRLVRSWTHLERQRGGFGFLGGPGETQIEADRRMIQERIASIERELVKVKQTRTLHRESRRRVPYPVVAFVGYTNAGKSTLFNRLTGADVLVRDMLFATLDPTMREVALPSGGKIILSDTVGFISELPTMLIAAFRATLEEVLDADIILHVRDISSRATAQQARDVDDILQELGIDREKSDRRILQVWNKFDLLAPDDAQLLKMQAGRLPDGRAVCVSAVTGEGVDLLLAEIDGVLESHREDLFLELRAGDGALLNWLFENTDIKKRTPREDGGSHLHIQIPQSRLGKLKARLEPRHLTGVSVS